VDSWIGIYFKLCNPKIKIIFLIQLVTYFVLSVLIILWCNLKAMIRLDQKY